MTEQQMQAAINGAYSGLGTRLGAGVARAREALAAALATGTAPDTLWQSDGSHPTAAGTRLVACALYRAVFGGAPPPAECAR